MLVLNIRLALPTTLNNQSATGHKQACSRPNTSAPQDLARPKNSELGHELIADDGHTTTSIRASIRTRDAQRTCSHATSAQDLDSLYKQQASDMRPGNQCNNGRIS